MPDGHNLGARVPSRRVLHRADLGVGVAFLPSGCLRRAATTPPSARVPLRPSARRWSSGSGAPIGRPDGRVARRRCGALPATAGPPRLPCRRHHRRGAVAPSLDSPSPVVTGSVRHTRPPAHGRARPAATDRRGPGHLGRCWRPLDEPAVGAPHGSVRPGPADVRPRLRLAGRGRWIGGHQRRAGCRARKERGRRDHRAVGHFAPGAAAGHGRASRHLAKGARRPGRQPAAPGLCPGPAPVPLRAGRVQTGLGAVGAGPVVGRGVPDAPGRYMWVGPSPKWQPAKRPPLPDGTPSALSA